MFTQDTQNYATFFTFTCDDCGEEIYGYSDTLKEAVDTIKQDGWRVVYDEDLKDFYHYCLNCI